MFLQFPYRLHEMLKDKDVDSSIVSWLEHGKAFRVHKPEEFVNKVMPLYFRQSHYKSFQRQLNLWGFERVGRGPEVGAYYHRHFLKGQPSLCGFMTRQKIKGTGGNSSSNSSGTQSPQAAAQASRRSSCPAVPSASVANQTNSAAQPFDPLSALADLAVLAGKSATGSAPIPPPSQQEEQKTSVSAALKSPKNSTLQKDEMKDSSESSKVSMQTGDADSRKEPKRPMSAYNIFFEHQRKRILAGYSLKDSITSDEFVQSIESVLLAAKGEGDDVADSDPQDKKQPDFEDLSRQVSQMWKSIDPVNKAILDCYASQEMRRYEAEVKTWRQHKDGMAPSSTAAAVKNSISSPMVQSPARSGGGGGVIGALRGQGDSSKNMFGGRMQGLSDHSLLARQLSGGTSQLQALLARNAMGIRGTSRRSSAPSMFAIPGALPVHTQGVPTLAGKSAAPPNDSKDNDESEKILPLKKRRSLASGESSKKSDSSADAVPVSKLQEPVSNSSDVKMDDVEDARRKVTKLAESLASKSEQLQNVTQAAAGRPILDFLRGGALLDRGSNIGNPSVPSTEGAILDLLRGGALPDSSLLPTASSELSRIALRQALLKSQLPLSSPSMSVLPSMPTGLLQSSLLGLSHQGGLNANAAALAGHFGADRLPLEGLGLMQNNEPKRPLSSFDIFYEIERHRILAGRTGKLTKEELALSIGDVFGSPNLMSHLSHGKNDEISQLIGELWKTIDPELKTILDNCASRDMARYRSELQIWAAQQGLKLGAHVDDSAMNQLAAEIAQKHESLAGSDRVAPPKPSRSTKPSSSGVDPIKETSFTKGANDSKTEKHSLPFPFALHNMLSVAEEQGKTSVVSWLPHGKAFRVNNKEVFVATMMTKYFKQTKFKSFQRQLNLWGFTRVTEGADTGAYFHTYFVRGEPALCKMMTRQKIKGASAPAIAAVAALQDKTVSTTTATAAATTEAPPSSSPVASPTPEKQQENEQSPTNETEKEKESPPPSSSNVAMTTSTTSASAATCPLSALASCATDKLSMPSIVRTAGTTASTLKFPPISSVTGGVPAEASSTVATSSSSGGGNTSEMTAATRDRAILLSNLALEVVGE